MNMVLLRELQDLCGISVTKIDERGRYFLVGHMIYEEIAADQYDFLSYDRNNGQDSYEFLSSLIAKYMISGTKEDGENVLEEIRQRAYNYYEEEIDDLITANNIRRIDQ